MVNKNVGCGANTARGQRGKEPRKVTARKMRRKTN